MRNFLTFLNDSKKYLFSALLILSLNPLAIRAQIKYLPADGRIDAGMGVERVARFFTPAYDSKLANSDGEVRWVQVDLGEKNK